MNITTNSINFFQSKQCPLEIIREIASYIPIFSKDRGIKQWQLRQICKRWQQALPITPFESIFKSFISSYQSEMNFFKQGKKIKYSLPGSVLNAIRSNNAIDKMPIVNQEGNVVYQIEMDYGTIKQREDKTWQVERNGFKNTCFDMQTTLKKKLKGIFKLSLQLKDIPTFVKRDFLIKAVLVQKGKEWVYLETFKGAKRIANIQELRIEFFNSDLPQDITSPLEAGVKRLNEEMQKAKDRPKISFYIYY